jgi:serine/threonine protein kinase
MVSWERNDEIYYTRYKIKYTILDILGEGSCAITYRVRENDSNNEFVIRTLSENLMMNRDRNRFEERLIDEATRLRQCNNPHIVKVKHIFKEDQKNVYCIVLDYIGGKNLAEIPDNELPLPENQALQYIQQIGTALIEVHSHGLVHRDIKRENIVLRASRTQAVLIDFGLVQKFEHPLTTRTKVSSEAEGFSAPEMSIQGEPCGPYTDIYSLAAILYFLLTGKIPPKASDRNVKNDPFEQSLISESHIKPHLKKAIIHGMRYNFPTKKSFPKDDERPETMKFWLQELNPPASNTHINSNPKPIFQRIFSRIRENMAKWRIQDWGAFAGIVGIIIAIATLLLAFPNGLDSWIELLNKETREEVKD